MVDKILEAVHCTNLQQLSKTVLRYEIGLTAVMLVTASWLLNADTRVNTLHEKLAVVVFRVFLSPLLSSSLSVL